MREAGTAKLGTARATLAILVVVCACVLTPVLSLGINKPYTSSADYVMFDIDNKILYCEGHTELLYGALRFQAENMRIDTKTNVMYSEGKVTVTTMKKKVIAAGATEEDECVAGQAPADSNETMEEEADRKLEETIACEKSGNVQTYEGDVLQFDLERISGVLIKTKSEMSKVYLQGEELYEVSGSPDAEASEYYYKEPSIQANAITAKRVRISPDDNYEAWNAKLWFKGNKVMQLPYWTNSGKKITKGNLRLKRVRYSSNSSWGIGTAYRYSEKRGKKGTVSIDYSGKGRRRYVATLAQQFKFSNQTSGHLGLGDLLGANHTYSMSLMRHGGGARSQNVNLNFSKKGRQSFRLGSNAKWGSTQIQSFFRAAKNTGSSTSQSNVDAMVRFNGQTKKFGGGGKYKIRMSSSLGWKNTEATDGAGNAFVGVSMFRSAIKLSSRSRVSTSFNAGLGGYTEGTSHGNFGTSIRYNLKIGNGKAFGLAYRYNQGMSRGSTNTRQSLSSTYSIAKTKLFNYRVSSTYDLRQSRIGTVSSSLRYEVNRKCALQSTLVYDTRLSRFNTKNYNLRYDFYGTMLSTYWYTESNDFVFDFATKF